MGILSIFIGASIAAAAPISAPAPVAQAPVQPHPALWVVNDHDTVVYLFGTFHALDGKSRWFEQAVKTAFFASDELMLETIVPEPPRPPAPVSQWNGRPLVPTGDPVVTLAPSASSLLTTSKTVMKAGRTRGMSTDQGADAVLREAAEDMGKFVGGLESFEFQLRMFNSLAEAPKPVMEDAKAVGALSALLAELQAAWNRGDIDTFALMLGKMKAQSPDLYKTMFVERNARWAQWIANRMKTPGTVFVAVGTGHLTGPDSVQSQLATLGVNSARIN